MMKGRLNSAVDKLVAIIVTACLLLSLNGYSSARRQHLNSQALNAANSTGASPKYYGTLVGQLQQRLHNASGQVFAVDEQTLFIRSFSFDGLAADTYFWSSVLSLKPSGQDGFIVPDEKGSTKPLERYVSKDVVLRLPEGKTLREINWLSIWSRQMQTSLADIHISRQLVIPRPLEIGPLSELAHGLKSGPITIVDAQTFLVPDFHYDGLGPDAYFWLTRGAHGLASNGLRLKDENGSTNVLRKYQGDTLVISLPDELTIYDFDFFGVWCRQFQMNFGQVRIPQQAKVPPSPKMLGIKPENKLNCEILYDDLGYEIRWVLDGDDIVMQLVGKIEPGEYMAFGLGKDDSRSDMENADAVVAWVDRQTGQVHAVDYYLGPKPQCTNQSGASCPDVKLPGGGDSLTLLHGAIVNGYSMVTFKRPQLGVDEQYDQHVYSDGQQSVLWAIGSLNNKQEIAQHRLKTNSNVFIDFARNPQWNCPIPDLNASLHSTTGQSNNNNNNQLSPISPAASQVDARVVSSRGSQPTTASVPETKLVDQPIEPVAPDVALSANRLQFDHSSPMVNRKPTNASSDSGAWFVPSIVCPSEKTLYAQIGPTGGKRGYEALTGRTSWGVSWYINGLMVPELVLERGQTYRFVVEGGNDKTSYSRRHPLYLTDSPDGGFDFKTDDERQKEGIFAGVGLRADGQFVPTAEGRLCEWKQTKQTLADPDQYPSFAAYQRTLKLDCLPGQAGMLKFTPDSNTPDIIYYQCYTYRQMGWRIRVVDSCQSYLKSLKAEVNNTPRNNHHNLKRDLSAQIEATNNLNRVNQTSNGSANSFKTGYKRRSTTLLSNGEELEATLSRLSAASLANQLEEPLRITEFNELQRHQSAFQSQTPNMISSPNQRIPPNEAQSSLRDDFVIINGAQLLNQKQPMNLTNYEQVLKLLPGDLEIIDAQPMPLLQSLAEDPFRSQASMVDESTRQANLMAALWPQLTGLHTFNNQTTSKQNKTTKPPKGLQVYIRRLASIYYPMQQQLASLANRHQNNSYHLAQLATASDNHDHAPASSSTSFSLYNLMPRPKIDLSKSNISKKLHKFRLKGWKNYDSQTNGPMKPPTPTNEFNYDIFNNQLAQLEKQQQQLNSLESLALAASANWASPSQFNQGQISHHDTMNYLPNIQAFNAYHASSNNNQQPIEDQQAIDSINQQHLFPSLTNHNQIPPATSLSIPHQSAHQTPSFLPHWASQPQLSSEQMALLDSAPNSTVSTGPIESQQIAQSNPNLKMSWLNPSASNKPAARAPSFIGSNPNEPSIFITRLASDQLMSLAGDKFLFGLQNQQTNQPTEHQSVQFSPASTPSVESYSSDPHNPMHHQSQANPTSYYQQATLSGQSPMFSLGSMNPPTYRDDYHDNRNLHTPSDAELLNGSGSGAHFDITRQPTAYKSGNEIDDGNSSNSDHMLAIERFSKHTFERQVPSNMQSTSGFQLDQPDQRRQNISYGQIRKHPQFSRQQYPAALLNSQPPVEILDVEQSVRTTEMQRVNASDPSLSFNDYRGINSTRSNLGCIVGSDASCRVSSQARAGSTESVPNVLMQPNGFDFLPDHSIMTTTPQFNNPTTSSTPSTIITTEPASYMPPSNSISNIDALIPVSSMQISTTGMSQTQTQTQNQPQHTVGYRSKESDNAVLRSNLIEPLSSTLVAPPVMSASSLPYQMDSFRFDSAPFTPIEFTSPRNFFQPQESVQTLPQQQQHQLNLPGLRLRPTPLESMISAGQEQFRPEPPVQVASYLANRLMNLNPNQEAQSMSQQQQQQQANINPDSRSSNGSIQRQSSQSPASELIILKPSILAKQTPQTYLLKPEYMTTIASGDNQIDSMHINEVTSAQLAGHLFDRLSSLSSPPSTSILLDPLQAANTILSYSRHTTIGPNATANQNQDAYVNSQSTSANGQMQSRSQTDSTQDYKLKLDQIPILTIDNININNNNNNTAKTNLVSTSLNSSSHLNSTGNDFNDMLAKHRQSILASKQILTNLDSIHQNNQIMADLDNRLDPGGDGALNAILRRDNKTDNAILSHVMSLISSNALPNAPVLPALGYSRPDHIDSPFQLRTQRSLVRNTA